MLPLSYPPGFVFFIYLGRKIKSVKCVEGHTTYHCSHAAMPDSRHFITGELTLTLMILLLKLFSTTIMSSESVGESVPSWLQYEDGKDKESVRTESLQLMFNSKSKSMG